jgi:hypothetical protein
VSAAIDLFLRRRMVGWPMSASMGRGRIADGRLGARQAQRITALLRSRQPIHIRGFALKFYTEQGNWDLVGNNTPVFFFRDPLRFPDLNHVVNRDPHTGMRNAENKWDFFIQVPESLHQLTIEMGERGIPPGRGRRGPWSASSGHRRRDWDARSG